MILYFAAQGYSAWDKKATYFNGITPSLRILMTDGDATIYSNASLSALKLIYGIDAQVARSLILKGSNLLSNMASANRSCARCACLSAGESDPSTCHLPLTPIMILISLCSLASSISPPHPATKPLSTLHTL